MSPSSRHNEQSPLFPTRWGCSCSIIWRTYRSPGCLELNSGSKAKDIAMKRKKLYSKRKHHKEIQQMSPSSRHNEQIPLFPTRWGCSCSIIWRTYRSSGCLERNSGFIAKDIATKRKGTVLEEKAL